MSGAHIVFIQAHAQAAAHAEAAAQPTIVQGMPVREQIRNQIRQSIQDVNRAVAESQDMQQEIRDAQQHVREAEQQLRDARTADQRGAAQQELFGARAELSALQGIGKITVHTSPAPFVQDMIPPQAVDISIAFFIMIAVIIIGWPLARAFGRRLERRADTPALPDAAISGQLQRIEQAVEAMSIEIERISESQRFMAKLQNGAPDRPPLGAGERR
jgi:cation transport ATPase